MTFVKSRLVTMTRAYTVYYEEHLLPGVKHKQKPFSTPNAPFVQWFSMEWPWNVLTLLEVLILMYSGELLFLTLFSNPQLYQEKKFFKEWNIRVFLRLVGGGDSLGL